jgi:hypothetical protein
MKYDVIITRIGSAKAKGIIARHLAHDLAVSMENVYSMLENLPVAYLTDVTFEDARFHAKQLEKIQVGARLVESVRHTEVPRGHLVLDVPPAPPPKPLPVTISASHLFPDPAETPPAGPTGPGLFTKKNISVAVGTLLLFVAGLTALFSGKNGFDWTRIFSLDWTRSAPQALEKKKKKAGAPQAADTLRKKRNGAAAGTAQDMAQEDGAASEERKQQAAALVDSARTMKDADRAIAFYRLAVAFNKHNTAAWYGLHDAYSEAMMTKEAQETEESMKRLFGDNIFSIQTLVAGFGTASDMSFTEDGTYRIEYQSRESDPKKIVRESYLLMKAMKNSCLCKAISLYIRTNRSRGVLVYADAQSLPASFEEFESKASITYLK